MRVKTNPIEYIYSSDSQIDSYFYGDYEKAKRYGWEQYEYPHLKDSGIFGWRHIKYKESGEDN